MKPENLESLLLDRALGQLSPEVADLLDDHLRQNPSAAARAATLGGTLDLARQAVAGPAPVSDASLASVVSLSHSWTRVHRAERRQRVSRETLKLAACIALGLATGWVLRPASEKAPLVASAQSLPVPALPREKNAAASFWSAARFDAETAAAARAEATPTDALPSSRPRWPLPVKSSATEGKR